MLTILRCGGVEWEERPGTHYASAWRRFSLHSEYPAVCRSRRDALSRRRGACQGVFFLIGQAVQSLAADLFKDTVNLARCTGLSRGSTRVTESHWLSILAGVRSQLGVWQSVRLRRSPMATMPLTWGVLRPVLLLPAEADEWTAARQQMVLWHELAHIRRCDWLTQMLANVADLPPEQRKSLMVAGLNELVFVIQLAVRTRLGKQEEAVVSGIIKEGFRRLGAA